MALLFRLSGRNEIQYRPLPKHPATTRDLAVLCKEETPIGQIEKMIRSVAGKTIESIQLFDVYTGQQIEAGKKSHTPRSRPYPYRRRSGCFNKENFAETWGEWYYDSWIGLRSMEKARDKKDFFLFFLPPFFSFR